MASVDYEAPYVLRDMPEEAPTRSLIRHSAGWYRFDTEFPNPQLRTSGFAREGYEGAIYIVEVGNAKMTTRVASLAGHPVFALWGQHGTRMGETEMAGERCELWRIELVTPEVGTKKRLIACVAADGILVYAALEDQPKVALVRAVSVQRRVQNPAWFTMPAGVRMRDVPDLPAFYSEVEIWAKSLTSKPRRK